MNKNLLTLTLLVILSLGSRAQQYLSFSQFSYNKGEFNPGYTGYQETFNATLIHRSQWVGFKGAPSSQTLLIETPINRTKWAIAGRLTRDKIGPTTELILGADIAYRLRMRKRRTLSFGAKVLGSYYQTNLTDLSLISDYYGVSDQHFLYNPKASFIPNIGFGMYYYSKDFYIGLSAPRMLKSKLNKLDYSSVSNLGRTAQVYYFMTGYTYKVNRDFSFLPNLTLIGSENSPLSIGTHLNFIFMKQFTLVASYHFKESAGLAFQWSLDKKWKIGYAIDFATNSLIRTNYGSHEILLKYILKAKTKRIIYPRYF